MNPFKLSDDDDKFVQAPQDTVLIFAGASGTESWIERDRDTTVRLIIKAVGVATQEDGILEVCIEMNGAVAKGQDGPASIDSHLRASQSVQVVVKAGQRLTFKAYPNPTGVKVLRTAVCVGDLEKTPPPAVEE